MSISFPYTFGPLSGAIPTSDLDSNFTAINAALGTAAFLNVGTGASQVVQLTAASKLPAVDGSLLTGLSTSVIVQVVEATPYVTYSSTATSFPYDDNIPQNTAGAQWNSVTITPTNASNRLRIEAEFSLVQGSGASDAAAAIFQDSNANALAVSYIYTPAAYDLQMRVTHEMAAGIAASPTTFKVRAGGNGTTLYVNGSSAARKGGGTSAVRMRVTEIKV